MSGAGPRPGHRRGAPPAPAAPVVAARAAARAAGVLVLCAWACGGEASRPAARPREGEALRKTTRSGPVTATVSLTPAQPRIGDPMRLTLTVEAEPGVELEMPPFGEALGRFQVISYTPRRARTAAGGSREQQEYVLQAPMSGRLRIPALRIEFTDRRSQPAAPGGTQGGGAPPPGAASAPGAGRLELLTDELAVEVQSALPDGAENRSLMAPREALPLPVPGAVRWLVPTLAGAALLVAAALLVRAARRRRQLRDRVSAYDRARRDLDRLAGRGLPGPAAADAWYVELSAVVRRYLEDRFAVRAPELTTEEFLREAQRSSLLSPAHRELLSDFLARCDRVKFAGYQPAESESQEVLDAAHRFLEETRVSAASPATGAAA